MTKPLAARSSRKGKKCRNHPDRPVRGRGLCNACWVKQSRVGKKRVRRFDPILGKTVELVIAEEDTVLGQLLADLPKPPEPEEEPEPKPKHRRNLSLFILGGRLN